MFLSRDHDLRHFAPGRCGYDKYSLLSIVVDLCEWSSQSLNSSCEKQLDSTSIYTTDD